MEPPVAPAQDGIDPYAWMRDTSDPAVLAYLAAERAYYDQQTAHTAPLRDALAAEMSARLAPADQSAGWELGGWHYFTRTLPGLNYEQFCRRSVSGAGPEQVLLDENLLLDDPACGGGYVALGVREVSPDGRLLAYSADFDGDEVYQLRIRDLATGTDRPERIERSYYGLAWSADSRSVFYTVTDPIYRPYQVWRHDVGTDPDDDVCVYTEDDERFEVFVRLSRSGAVIFIECESRETTETLVHPGNGRPFGPHGCRAPAARYRVPGRSCRRPRRRRPVPGHQRRRHRVPAGEGAGHRAGRGRLEGGCRRVGRYPPGGLRRVRPVPGPHRAARGGDAAAGPRPAHRGAAPDPDRQPSRRAGAG